MKMPAIKKVLASKNERIFPAETDRFALSRRTRSRMNLSKMMQKGK
jgi:hypothetical protein